MFGALLIGSSPERSRVIQNAAVEARRVLPLRTLESYPGHAQLVHLLNSVDPDLILLDASHIEAARTCAGVAASRTVRPGLISFSDKAGLVTLGADPLFPVTVPYPPGPALLSKAVDAALHSRGGETERQLVCFLPAKAGSGASTVVLNTAAALAAMNRRVLLMETDLRSGVLATMAGAEPSYSIAAVLRSSSEIDRFRLENAIVRRHGVDMLLAGRAASVSAGSRLPEWDDYFRLLEIVKASYDHILVDLPEVVNPATRELVQRSVAVYVVATPELLSLELAARRMKELGEWNVPMERISLLLNRWSRSELSPEEAARASGCQVSAVIPNDYVGLRRALSNGAPAAAHSALGRAYHGFAAQLSGPAAQSSSSNPNLLRWLFSAGK